MRIHFILSEEEDKNPDAINNFTVANALYNFCQENNKSICEQKQQLDAKIIAEMILLQYAKENATLSRNSKRK